MLKAVGQSGRWIFSAVPRAIPGNGGGGAAVCLLPPGVDENDFLDRLNENNNSTINLLIDEILALVSGSSINFGEIIQFFDVCVTEQTWPSLPQALAWTQLPTSMPD